MTAHAREGFPFASVDSTTWIAESCAIRRRGEKAMRIGGLVGKVAQAFDRISKRGVTRFVLESYKHAGTERWCKDAKGQAGTPFMRLGHGRSVAVWSAIIRAERKEVAA